MKQLEEEYGSETIIHVDYHIQAPLDTPTSHQRRIHYGVSGTPTTVFNGGLIAVGVNPPPVINRYRSRIEMQLGQTSPVSLSLSAPHVPKTGSVQASVAVSIPSGEEVINFQDCRVRALLYENEVSAGGTFHQIVRSVFVDQGLTVGGSGESTLVTGSISLDPAWKAEDLFVVAWIERVSTKEILQTVRAPVGEPLPVINASWGAVKQLFR